MESVETHRKLLEKKVTLGYDESVEQLKAAQQQWVVLLLPIILDQITMVRATGLSFKFYCHVHNYSEMPFFPDIEVIHIGSKNCLLK